MVRFAPVPLIDRPESGATAWSEDVAVTVNWSGVTPAAASETVNPSAGLPVSPSAAGSPAAAVVTVGSITGGLIPPPVPMWCRERTRCHAPPRSPEG